jgi:hypothetical protein
MSILDLGKAETVAAEPMADKPICGVDLAGTARIQRHIPRIVA